MTTRSNALPVPQAPTAGGTLPFFAMALGITWVFQLPAVLAQRRIIPGGVEPYLLPALIGGFGPLIAAVISARGESGAAGVQALLRSARTWRVGAHWYLVALFGLAALYVVARAACELLGVPHAGQWLYPPERAQHIAAMIVVPIAEEPGWRGFALPRLQARHGAVRASLLLGVAWAAWHTMMFVLQGATVGVFIVSMANIFVGSVVFSWLYNRTRGSLLLAMLAHVGASLNNPGRALPQNATPLIAYTIAIAVAGALLLVCDRAAWTGRLEQPASNPS